MSVLYRLYCSQLLLTHKWHVPVHKTGVIKDITFTACEKVTILWQWENEYTVKVDLFTKLKNNELTFDIKKKKPKES